MPGIFANPHSVYLLCLACLIKINDIKLDTVFRASLSRSHTATGKVDVVGAYRIVFLGLEMI